MVSTWMDRQQNNSIFSQLSESNTNFMLRQHDHEAQIESGVSVLIETLLQRMQIIWFKLMGQKWMRTVEKNVGNKVRSEVDSVMPMV